jgi:hypothetical protein
VGFHVIIGLCKLAGGGVVPKVNFGGREVDATEIEFQTRREDWNEYQLMDGSVIKLKAVVSDILRIEGHYDNDGNPVYRVKSSSVLWVRSPDELKKKP